ncbi:hypothetical protein Trydic_g9177 [Trypoxylus dichotomus]
MEGILNSRPLSPISSDQHNFQPLTPAHFLIGRTITAISEANLRNIHQNRLTYHQQLQQLRQLWSRWSKEYLAELQQRTRWTTNPRFIELGTLVLLKENNLSVASWRSGIVAQVHPGSDVVTRVVSISTPNGLLKRTVSQICPLPMEPEKKVDENEA